MRSKTESAAYFLRVFLPQLHHIIFDLKGAEAAYKAGEPAETVLLDIKVGKLLFQFLVDNA